MENLLSGCYKLTLSRTADNSVLNKANATIYDNTKTNSIEWYVPHFTQSIPQQTIISKQILNRTPKELQNIERNVFLKEVNTQTLFTFELGNQDGINVALWIFVDFQKRDREKSQI